MCSRNVLTRRNSLGFGKCARQRAFGIEHIKVFHDERFGHTFKGVLLVLFWQLCAAVAH